MTEVEQVKISFIFFLFFFGPNKLYYSNFHIWFTDNYADGIRNFLLANDNKKMEIHSWHDLNNMAMLKTLGLEVETYPEPTSSIIIEMHNRSGHQFFEVYFKLVTYPLLL